MTIFDLLKLPTNFIKKNLLLWVLLLTGLNVSMAQTTLDLGDIAVTGYQSDTPDKVSIVFLKAVDATTSFTITDNGWLDTGGFRPGEGTMTVTIDQALECGTEVLLVLGPPAFTGFLDVELVDGTDVGNITSVVGNISLSTAGDQVFIYQGPTPTLIDQSSFITAIQMNGNWDLNAISPSTSAQPSVFTDGVNSFSISPEIDNAVVNCDAISPMGSPAEISESIYSSTWVVSGSAGLNMPADCDFECVLCTSPSITCPADNLGLPPGCNPTVPDGTTMFNVAGDPSPNPAWPTVTDGCEPLVLTFDDATNDVGCMRTVTRTYTITDDNGDFAECDQLFTFVVDTQNPNFPDPPDEIINTSTAGVICPYPDPSISLTADPGRINPLTPGSDFMVHGATFQVPSNFSDNCVPAPQIYAELINLEVNGQNNQSNPPCTRIIRIRWAVVDACGNERLRRQLFFINDDVAPVPPAPPADFVGQCASDVPPPVDLTATDVCQGDITASPSAVITPGNCDNQFTMVRTWTFTDDCGNTSSVSQNITIFDNTPPDPPAPPADFVGQCASDVPPPVDLTATDACQGDITVSPSAVITPGNCDNQFTMVRTWTFTDDCGNTSSVSQNITIFDDTPPDPPAPPADIIGQCASDVPPPVDLTAQDNCDGAITVSPSAVITPGNCPNQFTMVRTWTFTDGCGNTSSVSQNITIFDDTPPVLSAMPGNATVECDAIPPAPVITATDNCASVAPVIFINEIHYDNDGGDVGEFIEVAGTAGFDLSACQLVLYNGSNSMVYNTMDLSGMIDDEGTGFGAVDFQYPSNGIQNGSPDGMALVCGGVVIQFLSYEGTITAVGGPADGMMSVDIGVNETDDPPLLQSLQLTGTGCNSGDFAWNPPAPQSPGTINPGQTFDLAQCQSSNDVPVIFTENSTPGACPQEQTITRIWSAMDECGNNVTHTQVITVVDTTIPEFCNAPTDITVDCLQDVPVAEVLGATDNCDFSGMSSSVWINEFHYDNSGTDAGEFIEVAGVAGTDLSTYQLLLYNGSNGLVYNTMQLSGVIDNESCNRGALSFTYPVNGIQNGPDAIALVQGVTVIEFLSYEGSFTANDGPAMGLLSTNVGVSETSGTPVGSSLQLSGTGASPTDFVWTGPFAASPGSLNTGQIMQGNLIATLVEDNQATQCDGGTIIRTWTVEDACGNAAVPHVQTITVNEPAAPVVTCPADMTVTCFEDIDANPDDLIVVTSCGQEYTVYVKNPLISGIPGCDGTIYTYIYVAVDECGRSSECEQQFLLQNSAPVVTVPADETVTCFEDIEVSVDDITVVADCEGDLTLNVLPPVLNGSANCPGATYTYTYRVKDACNRIVEVDRIFTIGNNAGPTITAPDDFVSECAVSVNPDNAIVTTACGNGVDYEVTVSSPEVIGNPVCDGTVYRYTYTVTDACGRTASDIQEVTLDNEGPVLNCPGTCTILNCDEGDYEDIIQAWIATFTATASCGGNVMVFNNYNGVNGLCVFNGITPVTFTAIDECGRSTTCTEVIFITDSDAPIIFEEPQELLVPCNGATQDIFDNWLATQGGAEAIDACWGNDITWSTIPSNPTLDCDSGPQAIVVEFVATDGCGNAASVTGVFNTKVQPEMVNISGQVFREDSEAVADVQVGIQGGNSGLPDMDYTGNTGAYGFPELEFEDSLTIVPEKNNDPLNGVTTYDLVLLSKHILFIETLDSPYKQIAADVNRSGHISTIDLVLLRRLILFIDDEFTQNTSWRFVDAEFVFSNPANPFETTFPEIYMLSGLEEEEADFIGVKIGDLDLSAQINGLMADTDDRTDPDYLNFKVENQQLKPGQPHRIDFTAQNFEQIEGFQFTLNFDQSTVEVIELQAADLINFDHNNYGLSKLNNGAITVSWNHENIVDLKPDEVVFSLILEANRNARLSDLLSISSEYTKAEAYQSGEVMNVNLVFNDQETTVQTEKFRLFQNQPNPFKEATSIGFYLPEGGAVSLKIFDVSGRLIHLTEGDYSKGYNNINVDRADLPDSGIFYYQVETARDTKSKKMILID